MASVDRGRTGIWCVRDVEFYHVHQTICLVSPKPRVKPVFENPKPLPESPPITIEKNFDFLEWSDGWVEFDAELLGVLDAYWLVR